MVALRAPTRKDTRGGEIVLEVIALALSLWILILGVVAAGLNVSGDLLALGLAALALMMGL